MITNRLRITQSVCALAGYRFGGFDVGITCAVKIVSSGAVPDERPVMSIDPGANIALRVVESLNGTTTDAAEI